MGAAKASVAPGTEALKPARCSSKAICGVLRWVLANESDNPRVRSGLQRPFVFQGNKIDDRQVAYRPGGRGAVMIFLNYCPFCGFKFKR